ncbi:hypothetical protein BJ878DRAFT_545403 [Calycina marina]|uniref:Uncharacterized protein n=1 Tax=Calycina marina TaxID=1763456 RepID=A0A9P7YWZ7_9HELO|nr:hypothetical protein BJ878DRAFT_545403 [Calycina marina]
MPCSTNNNHTTSRIEQLDDHGLAQLFRHHLAIYGAADAYITQSSDAELASLMRQKLVLDDDTDTNGNANIGQQHGMVSQNQEGILEESYVSPQRRLELETRLRLSSELLAGVEREWDSKCTVADGIHWRYQEAKGSRSEAREDASEDVRRVYDAGEPYSLVELRRLSEDEVDALLQLRNLTAEKNRLKEQWEGMEFDAKMLGQKYARFEIELNCLKSNLGFS